MKIRWLLMSFLIALPAGQALAAPGKILESRRIVVFDQKIAPEMRSEMVAKLGFRVIRDLGLIDAVVVGAPSTMSDVDFKLMALPSVVRVDEDLKVRIIEDNFYTMPLPRVGEVLERIRSRRLQEGISVAMPTVGKPADPSGEEAPWGIKRVNAPAAWPATMGQGAKVAIVDTGIDLSHPDLAANIAGGYNAIITTASAQDDHGHGTHVAGTVAAVLDNNGVVGVAPRATLYAVKVLDENGSGYFSGIIAGIEWAVKAKVKVINMSLGGSRGNDSLHDAVKKAVAAGVTVVCAAGNSGGSVGYPAAYPEAIAVSAADSSDKIADFSSRGPEVDFIAPGVNILSSVLGGGYDSYSGTSMASPHMAGLAALAVAKGAKTPAAVRAALKAAAKPLKDLKPEEQGAGMPDASKIAGRKKTKHGA